VQQENQSMKHLINKYSADAGLSIIGFREETLNHDEEKIFEGFDELGNILFVNSCNKKAIE
jgi:hypothetical protein